jgi:hypothetical protein
LSSFGIHFFFSATQPHLTFAAALWSSAGHSRQTRRQERPNVSELRNIAPTQFAQTVLFLCTRCKLWRAAQKNNQIIDQ